MLMQDYLKLLRNRSPSATDGSADVSEDFEGNRPCRVPRVLKSAVIRKLTCDDFEWHGNVLAAAKGDNLSVTEINASTIDLRRLYLGNLRIGSVDVASSPSVLADDCEIRDSKIESLSAQFLISRRSSYKNMQIINADVSQGQIQSCSFIDCRLSGQWCGCNFINCRYENSDFSGATFHECTFANTDGPLELPNLPLLPNRTDNFLCPSWVAAEVLEKLEPKVGNVTRKWLKTLVSVWRRNRRYELIDPAWFDGEIESCDIGKIMDELYLHRVKQV